jgi:hypothetical protein
LLIG